MAHSRRHRTTNGEHWDIEHIPNVEGNLVGANGNITE